MTGVIPCTNASYKVRLAPTDKYIYSDNDFIFLVKIVEAISGMPLDEYVRKEFYIPLGLNSSRL